MRKSGKLLRLIIGVVAVNIIVLSPGLLGVKIFGGSALETATAITLLFMSFIVLLVGSYRALFKAPVITPVRDIKTHADYVVALHQYRNVRALRKDITQAMDQLQRMDRKKRTLMDILSQRFQPTELSYQKFQSVIQEVESVFYTNIRGILNKLSVFDASEFAAFAGHQRASQYSNKLMQEKANLYNEYLSLLAGYVGVNEEIMLKLDKLTLEISLLGSADYRDVDDMPCMKEIDALIKQTKYYKQ